MSLQLLRKYNVPGPRYTSYPTVPYWEDTPSTQHWKSILKTNFEQHKEEGISIYIHLPFCESLCMYCGCNKVNTKNHALERPYLEAVVKEWRMYRKVLGQDPLIKEIHLGGGTPTFFSAVHLEELITRIMAHARLAEEAELGIEVHPSHTTTEQLRVLRQVGFNRISIGVQDFDPEVQCVINRVQSYEEVEKTTREARALGYTSVNFDLIFGLPKQTPESIERTIALVNQLDPDRIAFYGYAHVPWTMRAQRLFTEDDIPQGEEKRALYETGRELLEKNGFLEVGMDHFAKKEDPLYQSFQKGEMHRNFMGYTTTRSRVMVGLGTSAISDAWGGYVQNEKNFRKYQDRVNRGELPFFRGHVLTKEDLIIKQHILNLMCAFRTYFDRSPEEDRALAGVTRRLCEMEADGLLAVFPKGILVSEKGKAFIRNICMAIDKRLMEKQPGTALFSQTV